jgi:hypothetical protein
MNMLETTKNFLEVGHDLKKLFSPWPRDLASKHFIDNNKKFMEDLIYK